MRHRILVVEDNPPNRELLSDWLEGEGFEVLCAENLEQSFAAFQIQPPHAVLLDVQLGREDGLSLAKWIRRDPKLRDLPIIAVTAHAMVTDQERVVQAGCDACISKPIDFKLLAAQLERRLGHSAKVQGDSRKSAQSLGETGLGSRDGESG
ncbi:MAG TPA: response regulator [Candidatus Acidoferrales bacterium]|nr:response regulator [Candidatus Acidoferrales bacterium]